MIDTISARTSFPASPEDPRSQPPGIRMRWHFATPLLQIGEWQCVAGNGGLGEERSQPWHVIGFPLSGTYRLHRSRDSVLVDSNQIMFFNANVGYRTSHPHGFGDSGGSLVLRGDVLEELLEVSESGQPLPNEEPFGRTHGRNTARAQLLVWLLLRRLPLVETLEPLDIEELALRIAGEAVRCLGTPATPLPDGARAQRQRRACIERVKDHFAERFTGKTDLESLSKVAGCSPFHLCRIFRRETGASLSVYRTKLRLGAALDRIEEDLASLALELGFSSHSHFTESFRRLFGRTPSAVRQLGRLRRDRVRKELAGLLPSPRPS
ncbi:MAG TPA: AraC family transcriptional regulator [Thermoanaerobaculia bacterium]